LLIIEHVGRKKGDLEGRRLPVIGAVEVPKESVEVTATEEEA
jgi:hypothetical protein